MHHATIKLNAAEGLRQELFRGRMHTVIPATIIVAGVLNKSLVTAEELAKFPEAWNGRPVPIFHPTENGEPISANWPDVLERTGGHVFNTAFDGDRLRSEFWLDEQLMDSLGEAPLLAAIREGKMVEVSTGYFCDTAPEVGEFNGRPYEFRAQNIRPDHVALLPGEVGACSIADGCGAPRVNSEAGTVNKAGIGALLTQLGAMIGIKTNCSCEGTTMTKADIIAKAKTLVSNKALEAKHLKALEGMDEEQVGMMAALLSAMSPKGNEDPPVEDPPVDDPAAAAAAARTTANAAKPITAGELQALIGKSVATALATELPKLQANLKTDAEREAIVARIVSNESNAFAEADLRKMSVESLSKYEQTLRPTDYSGAGPGFSANASGGEFVSEFAGGYLLEPATKQ